MKRVKTRHTMPQSQKGYCHGFELSLRLNIKLFCQESMLYPLTLFNSKRVKKGLPDKLSIRMNSQHDISVV